VAALRPEGAPRRGPAVDCAHRPGCFFGRRRRHWDDDASSAGHDRRRAADRAATRAFAAGAHSGGPRRRAERAAAPRHPRRSGADGKPPSLSWSEFGNAAMVLMTLGLGVRRPALARLYHTRRGRRARGVGRACGAGCARRVWGGGGEAARGGGQCVGGEVRVNDEKSEN
jgi:hypothetical protein